MGNHLKVKAILKIWKYWRIWISEFVIFNSITFIFFLAWGKVQLYLTMLGWHIVMYPKTTVLQYEILVPSFWLISHVTSGRSPHFYEFVFLPIVEKIGPQYCSLFISFLWRWIILKAEWFCFVTELLHFKELYSWKMTIEVLKLSLFGNEVCNYFKLSSKGPELTFPMQCCSIKFPAVFFIHIVQCGT